MQQNQLSSSHFFTAQEGEGLLEVTWQISSEARLPRYSPPQTAFVCFLPTGLLGWKVDCAGDRTSLLWQRGGSVFP